MVTAALHHDLVAGDAPRAWALWTHGIFGSGGNWRTVARHVVGLRPEWGVALVDLRLHGRSGAGEPPHTIDACAADLVALAAELAAGGRPVRAALGHSFGGKVVLAARPRLRPATTWVFDSTPSPRPGAWDAPGNSVRAVWDALRALDRPWASRPEFVQALAAQRGMNTVLAVWLAANLVPGDDGAYRQRLDLEGVRAMIADFDAVDLWSSLEDASLPGDAHIMVAERSSTVSADDRLRLAELARAGQLELHTVDAGHWINVDAPEEVIAAVARSLPPAP